LRTFEPETVMMQSTLLWMKGSCFRKGVLR
jgi:hypothetical protein